MPQDYDLTVKTLAALPIETQVAEVAAITAPENVRRFVVAAAPENLARRFSAKIREVSALELSQFEEGRILALQGSTKEAKRKFLDAIKSNDPRGHNGMGYLLRAKNIAHTDIIKHLEKAIKAGVDDSDTHVNLARALIFASNESDEPCNTHLPEIKKAFDTAIEKSPDPATVKNYAQAMKYFANFSDDYTAFMHSEKENFLDPMTQACQKGYMPAISDLITHLKSTGRPFLTLPYYLEGVRHGYTSFLVEAGAISYSLGNEADWEKYTRLAIQAGHVNEIYDIIINFYEQKMVEGAKKYTRLILEEAKKDPNNEAIRRAANLIMGLVRAKNSGNQYSYKH